MILLVDRIIIMLELGLYLSQFLILSNYRFMVRFFLFAFAFNILVRKKNSKKLQSSKSNN